MIPREILCIPAPDAETAEGALVLEEPVSAHDEETDALIRPIIAEATGRTLEDPRGSVTSWYDDDEGDDDAAQSKGIESPKPSATITPAALSRTTSESNLLNNWPPSPPTVATGDLRKAVKGRAKIKLKDVQGHVLRVSARVP